MCQCGYGGYSQYQYYPYNYSQYPSYPYNYTPYQSYVESYPIPRVAYNNPFIGLPPAYPYATPSPILGPPRGDYKVGNCIMICQ